MALKPFASSFWVIGVAGFPAVFTLHLEKFALLHTMILHVLPDHAKTAALDALPVLEGTRLFVVHRGLVASLEVALWQSTFELQAQKVLLDVSVQILEFYSTISSALFRAGIIISCPGLDAIGTEQGLAATALDRPTDDHGADAAKEEVGPLSLLCILLKHVSDVQMCVWQSTVRLWLV